jgi:hypothetical protein
LTWRDVGNVWSRVAAPQAFFVAAIVVKACLDAHRLDLAPLVSGYGILVLVPATLAAAKSSTTGRAAPSDQLLTL